METAPPGANQGAALESLIVSTLPEKASQPQQLGDVVAFRRPVVRAAYPAADVDQLEKFTSIIFRHCRDMKGWIAIRGFPHSGDGKPVLNEWFPLGRGLVQEAANGATQLANRTGGEAAVFSPPVAVFGDMMTTPKGGNPFRTASAANVVCAPAIAVELDERPSASLAALVKILGMPTIVVRSGGIWQAPDGTAEDKLHAYWRLASPAVSAEDRATLHRARDAATRLVGGDPTAVSLAHPMRWPGSWHTKTDTPRLCEIISGDLGGDPQRDVNLHATLVALEAAHVAAGLDVDTRRRGALGARKGFKTETEWPADELMEAAHLLPNEGRVWDDWNKWGMTFFDASHNSVEGLEAFHAWSEKDPRYDPDETDARWSHWHSSPPSDLSAGSLVREIRKTHPDYRKPPKPEPESFLDETPGPLDIFGEADPAELGRVPAGALPLLLERWVQMQARLIGVPPAFAALTGITAIGAAIDAKIKIQVKQNNPSYTEGSNLWGVLVADPGSAKSPIVSAALEAMRTQEKEWKKTDLPRHAEWEKASKTKRKDAPPVGAEPHVRRRLVDDITWEKCVRMFVLNPRLLRAPDEFLGMLDSFGAYKKGGGGDRSNFLRTFDGQPITYDRVSGGTLSADTASLAVIAGTQPEKMHEIAKNLGSDGLLQRCIFVLHDGVEREGIDELPDADVVAGYDRMVRSFMTAEHLFPQAIRMSAAAGALFASSWGQIRTLKNLPGVGPAFQGHIMKWEKILARLVLIFHCVRQFEADGTIDPTQEVEVETVQQAVRFGRFLLRHAIRFYGTYFGAPEAASEARWLAGHFLTKHELKEVNRRLIYTTRKALQGASGLPLLLAAMAELEGAGWCHVVHREADGPVSWRIDDRIHTRFAERGEREKRDRADRQARIVAAGSSKTWVNDEEASDDEAASGAFSVFD